MIRLLPLIAALVIPAGPAAAQVSDLPDIGHPVDNLLSLQEERRLGDQIVRQLRARGRLLENPEARAYVENLGYRLVAHSDGAEHRFRFFVLDDSSINAVALPGGYIGVNRGLVLASDTESELAAVIAHEIAHVTQRHIARRYASMRRMNMATAAAVLAALIAGGGNPDVAQAAIGTGMAASVQNQIRFTYANEQEADRLGMGILSRAGFDPSGMASFFEAMQRRSRHYEGDYSDFLRTHPMSAKRISEARARAHNLPERKPDSSLAYRLNRARLRVFGSDSPASTVEHFRDALDDDADDLAAHYGLALAMAHTGDLQPAREILGELVVRRSAVLPFRTALAQVQADLGETEDALETYQSALNLFPDNAPLILGYTATLLNAGEPRRARELLQRLPLNENAPPRQLRLLAEASRDLGNPADSHYYLSEYHLLQGDADMALKQLEIALNQDDLSDFNVARLKARRDEIKKAMEEARQR